MPPTYQSHSFWKSWFHRARMLIPSRQTSKGNSCNSTMAQNEARQ
jgi:hypothetical protein